MKLLLVLLITLVNTQFVFGCNIPENELIFRVAMLKTDKALQGQALAPPNRIIDTDSNISKKQFLKMIDSVKKIYVPIFRNLNMNFKIENLWEDHQVNAFAGASGANRYVLLYGGYARHKLMTPDAYLSVICHEIGHHLGGFPKKTSSSWSSSEGQADYFSTLKCMKEVLKRDPENEALAIALDLPFEVKKQCKFQFPKVNDYNICLRLAKASEEHGIVLADLVKKDEEVAEEVSLLTPSLEVGRVTNLKHPSPQCRLDTKYQGALCNVSTVVPLNDMDEAKGACHFNNFHIVGNRPACWFVHKKM